MVSGAGTGSRGIGHGGAPGRGVRASGSEWEREEYCHEDDFGVVATDAGAGGGVWISCGDDCRAEADRIST